MSLLPHLRRLSLRQLIRRSFFSGLLIVVQVVITGYVLQLLFGLADNILQPFLTDRLKIYIPGLGILATLVLIFGVGLFAQNLLAQRMLRLGEQTLVQIPLAGSIYGAIKQILTSFTRDEADRPQKVVLVPYPSEGLWALGFLNGEITGDDGRRYGLVLMLNSINPTTGLLTVLPLDRVKPLAIPVEEAMKIVISGGLVTPGRFPL